MWLIRLSYTSKHLLDQEFTHVVAGFCFFFYWEVSYVFCILIWILWSVKWHLIEVHFQYDSWHWPATICMCYRKPFHCVKYTSYYINLLPSSSLRELDKGHIHCHAELKTGIQRYKCQQLPENSSKYHWLLRCQIVFIKCRFLPDEYCCSNYAQSCLNTFYIQSTWEEGKMGKILGLHSLGMHCKIPCVAR